MGNNGIQKTYKEVKAKNYGKAILSGAVDTLDLLGGYGLAKKIFDINRDLIKSYRTYLFNNKYLSVPNNSPKFSQTSNNYVIKVGPTKDYSESPSLFAQRLDSGGAERVGYPKYALPKLHSGTGPHMEIVIQNNKNLINKSIGTYVDKYIPTQETSGKFIGVGSIEPNSMHPILDNSSVPRHYFNSGVVDIIDESGKKIVSKNVDRPYSKLTPEEKRDILDHELHHTIDLIFRGPDRQYSPMGKFLDFSKLDKGPNPDYFKDHVFVNGSSWNEVAPRVTQIKNFLGITDGKTLMTADKIKIICPEHGEFWQTPGNHIYLSHGCPRCRLKNQNHIFEFFRKNLPNKTILWEYSPDWLYPQRIDIFIKELSVAIEYNGEQHYTPIDIFGGIETFNKQKELDVRKYNKCVENRCKVFYIKYNYTDQTLNDILNELR